MTTRRSFLKASMSLSLIPLVNLDVMTATASEKVPANDPMATALKYVADATKATRTDKSGVASADQFCKNCQLYTASDEAWGACALFQNRLVAVNGWCSGWTARV